MAPEQKDTLPQKTKKKKLRIKDKRIPRPLGITYLTRRYNEEDNKGLRKKILYRIKYQLINHFLNHGFKLNNYQYDILEYLGIYGISQQEYQTILKDIVARTSGIQDIGNMAEVQDNIRAKLLGALNWALGDRHQAQAQLQVLLASQGTEYKAFISSEVNKMIKTGIDATKNFAEIAKSLLPAAGIVIKNNNSNVQNSITTERALEILKDEPTILELSEEGYQPKQLLPENELSNLPDISAISQASEITQQVTLHRKAIKKATHEERRAALNNYEDVLDE